MAFCLTKWNKTKWAHNNNKMKIILLLLTKQNGHKTKWHKMDTKQNGFFHFVNKNKNKMDTKWKKMNNDVEGNRILNEYFNQNY